MKKVLALLLALTMLFAFAACGEKKTTESPTPASTGSATTDPAAPELKKVTYDKPELELVFPEINAEAGQVCIMEQFFADRVLEETNGRIKINIYGGGQLGSEAETMEMLYDGTVAFMRINPANMSTRGIDIPEYTAMGLPYLIQSIEGGIEYLYSKSGAALADKIAEVTNCQVYSLYNYIVTTPRHMFTTTLCATLGDFASQKVRSESSDIKVDMINSWASATPLAMNDIYTSLQTGVITGCENAIHGYYDNAWYEVAPFVLETGHSINASVYMLSGAVYDQLKDGEYDILISCLKEACDYFQDIQEESTTLKIDELKTKGVTFTECADRDSWMAACDSLYAKYAAGLSDFIADIQSYK